MVAVIEPAAFAAPGSVLLGDANNDRTVAWRGSERVSVADFLIDVARAASVLPNARAAINLCEDRYAFLVAFCAIMSRGQTNLLPPSRARQAVDEAMAAYPGSYVLSDMPLLPAPEHFVQLPAIGAAPRTELSGHAAGRCCIDRQHVAAIGFTSGSTGQPKPNLKTWNALQSSSARNSAVLVDAIGLAAGAIANIVATVPPQHMYGVEMSILLPLLGPFAVHGGRPLFPADVAAALACVPEPRVLVTTPIHLRALLRDGQQLPTLAAITSATAPLSRELAAEAEARFGAEVVEFFGSTETCVIARRRTAREENWHLYPDVDVRPQPDGSLIDAPYFSEPVALPDVVELLPDRCFNLRGRHTDLVDIAGKRASLADLTRRVLAIEGVNDAVVFQLDEAGHRPVARVAALVVAPERTERDLLEELRSAMDPAFLPRPLHRVDRLPRNETGKLPRAALLAALREPR